MKKKLLKISSLLIATSVVVTGVTIPVVSCSSNKEERFVFEQDDLNRLWHEINDYTIKNKVTAATTNPSDSNWKQHIKKITTKISSFKLADGSTLGEHTNELTINRELASINFKLNTKCKPVYLEQGYIIVEENGTINLNHLAISSPEQYFLYDPNNKENIQGLSPEGEKEVDILIPYGVKKINGNTGFFKNKIMKNLIIPDTVVEFSIYSHGFQWAKSLEYAKLSRNIKSLPQSAFSNTSLKRISIYEGITEIGSWSFFRSNLTGDLVLPKTLKTIHPQSFDMRLFTDDPSTNPDFKYGQPNLTSLTTWANKFGTSILAEQKNLKTIKLMTEELDPVNVHSYAFSYIPKTTKIYVKNENVKNVIVKRCIKEINNPKYAIDEKQIIVNPYLF